MRFMCFVTPQCLAIVLGLGVSFQARGQSIPLSGGGVRVVPETSDLVPLENLEQYLRLMHEGVNKKKVEVLTQAMRFTPEQAAKFWPIYAAYTAELNELGDARLRIVHDYVASFNTMDDQKADALAERLIHFYTRRIALQQRYYEAVKQQLGARVAARFLQVETRLVATHDMQIAAQVPLLQ